MTYNPKKDSDFYIRLALVGFFSIVFLCVEIFYSDWGAMSDTFWHLGLLGGIIANIGVFASAVIAVAEWQDPNFDWVEKFFFVFAIVAILYVGAFKAAHNENTMMNSDIQKAKQEAK